MVDIEGKGEQILSSNGLLVEVQDIAIVGKTFSQSLKSILLSKELIQHHLLSSPDMHSIAAQVISRPHSRSAPNLVGIVSNYYYCHELLCLLERVLGLSFA